MDSNFNLNYLMIKNGITFVKLTKKILKQSSYITTVCIYNIAQTHLVFSSSILGNRCSDNNGV